MLSYYLKMCITESSRSIEQMKHMGAITSLAINISDDILYSASLDKTVKVWRISDHKCIETIQAHTEPVNAIVVADDGVLYTASDDATVRVWRRNFCSGDRPHSLTVTLPAKNSPVKTLSLTGDGAVLYGGCTDGYIHYWHKGWFSGQLQYGGALQGHTHAVMCLASVSNYVISGSADSTCRVWTRERDGQHKCLAVLQGHRGPVRCVSVLPARARDDGEDGCSICTGSLDGILKVWHVSPKGNAGRRSPQNGWVFWGLTDWRFVLQLYSVLLCEIWAFQACSTSSSPFYVLIPWDLFLSLLGFMKPLQTVLKLSIKLKTNSNK